MPRPKDIELADMAADEELRSLLQWAERMQLENVAAALRRILIKIGSRLTQGRAQNRRMGNPAAKTVTITVDLTPDEALALAQFVKRSLFDTYREFAVDEPEAHLMLAAVENLRKGLAAEGFSPR